ncbi:MAG: DNA recombination protein RmuC [Oscillospiraceae bacterium]|jgi:DNA recombination protein RmuC|nr:DNA recombination protein RmuC [Oscillospiraceae bacterium]
MDYIIIALGILILILQCIVIIKKPAQNSHEIDELRRKLDDLMLYLNSELQRSRQELSANLERFSSRMSQEFLANRQESAAALKEINEKILKIQDINTRQSDKLGATLAEAVGKLQESNEKKLDQMRQTVDEKLTSTLNQRLDSSFKLVGEQLKDVHKSLGEMKELASDVSDLQRVLTNVKARGTWAEVQLGNILEQTLTNDQYQRNVSPKNNNEMVEYAIKIPSRDKSDSYVWLPIDSKFPQEDYMRLCDATEKADKAGVEEATKALERRIKDEAAKISRQYINVPVTTDFAIMFLPTEGLYAEILRRPGLAEEIQTKHRVMVCGPTTITAFLNTLRMGFRTIALDKRASEVWKVLGAVKMQYDNFDKILNKVRKKLDEAGNTLDDAQKRNRIINKKLKTVEQVDETEADELLGINDEDYLLAEQ